MAAARGAAREGQRCAEQYRKDGSFPVPRELRDVAPGEVVIAHEVVDLHREQPAWRLYLLAKVMGSMADALDWQDIPQVRARYEADCLATAWGALYFAVEQPGILRPGRVGRPQAVLRSWEALQQARYGFKPRPQVLTLDELMRTACEWAMRAWGSTEELPVRTRLELAAESMARATREDCIGAILREVPRVLAVASHLKHPEALAEPSFLRERLEQLPPENFDRVSSACTADLLGLLSAWIASWESTSQELAQA